MNTQSISTDSLRDDVAWIMGAFLQECRSDGASELFALAKRLREWDTPNPMAPIWAGVAQEGCELYGTRAKQPRWHVEMAVLLYALYSSLRLGTIEALGRFAPSTAKIA